jgi:hypothetical protein
MVVLATYDVIVRSYGGACYLRPYYYIGSKLYGGRDQHLSHFTAKRACLAKAVLDGKDPNGDFVMARMPDASQRKGAPRPGLSY